MKKFSTPVGELSEPISKEFSNPNPKALTIAFLRQFARAYRPAPVMGMPGIVLN